MAFAFCVPLPAAADEREVLEQKLSEAYNGKTLKLRGNYCDRSLKFNAQGEPRGDSRAGDWTLCRDILVQKVRVGHGHLQISGRRIFWMFDGQAAKFRDVTETADNNRKDFAKLMQEQAVSVEVAFPDQSGQQEIESLLNHIFWPAGTDPRETASPIWNCYLRPDGQERKDCLAFKTTSAESHSGSVTAERVGGKVKAPRARYWPDPSYGDEARQWKLKGVTVLNVIVGSDGNVTRPQIARPLGMGLDARAAEMVSTWRFDPATRDGVPVPVAVTIEVSFSLY